METLNLRDMIVLMHVFSDLRRKTLTEVERAKILVYLDSLLENGIMSNRDYEALYNGTL